MPEGTQEITKVSKNPLNQYRVDLEGNRLTTLGLKDNVSREARKNLATALKMSRLKRDFKKEKANREKTQELATKDPLTELLNRRGGWERIREEINRAIRNGTKLCVFFMDLNNLKERNSISNEMGDKLIMGIATSLKKGSRPVDILIRYGGDEFVVMLPETDIDEALTYWLRQEPILRNNDIWVSVGLAEVNVNNPENSINRAEEAMRAAKKIAKDRYGKIGIKDNVLELANENTGK